LAAKLFEPQQVLLLDLCHAAQRRLKPQVRRRILRQHRRADSIDQIRSVQTGQPEALGSPHLAGGALAKSLDAGIAPEREGTR
jgi:hypothetical protein